MRLPAVNQPESVEICEVSRERAANRTQKEVIFEQQDDKEDREAIDQHRKQHFPKVK